MADLDYAFLADFAAVQDGKLSTIGASFTFVRTQALPAAHMLSVAGRVRGSLDEAPPTIEAQILGPDESYEIKWSGVLEAGGESLPYGEHGRVGLLFALTIQVPLMAAGLYVVNVSVNGEQARRLAFEVELASVS